MENLIETMADVFALANNATEFVKNILKESKSNKKDVDDAKLASSGDDAKLASSGNWAKLASSGYGAQLASSGYGAQLASSGNWAKLASSGDDAQLASSGNWAKLASSGYGAQLASSGYGAQLASSGYGAKLASSGYGAQLASSGYGAQLASSGNWAKLASSGDDAQLASSGNWAKLASSGDDAQLASSGNYAKVESAGADTVISAIGAYSIIKAKKGSWITLAEYKKEKGKYKPFCVKTEYVDGERIKEGVFYCLFNKEFHESFEFDGIRCAVLSKKGNVYKVVNFGEDKIKYVVTDGKYYSHGDTIKQAKADLIYKISNRDTSKYSNLKLDSIVTKEEAIKMYRVITGACEAGTKYFVNSLAKTKSKYKISELIEITKGQYGNETFRKFFGEKKR